MKRQSILKHFLIIVLLHIGICKIHATNDYDKLINAIAHVESKHNEKLVSKNKTHVGLLQISKITVDECNRIIGMKKYTYQDRYDKNKSIEMFFIIQNFYNKKGDIEKAIRLWNGGPRYSKIKTNAYFNKVIRRFRQI